MDERIEKQITRTEDNPEINPHKWIDKGEKAIQWSKDNLSTNGAEKIGHLQARAHTHTKNLDTEITPVTKNNSKWTTDLHVKRNPIKPENYITKFQMTLDLMMAFSFFFSF